MSAMTFNGVTPSGVDSVTQQVTGTAGTGNPQVENYANFKTSAGGGTVPGGTTRDGYTMTFGVEAGKLNAAAHVYDPWGHETRGRKYDGAWVNPYGYQDTKETNYWKPTADGGVFKYNHMLMTMAENFDTFMQKQEAEDPHWWINRIPRRAYKLFNGVVQQTNVYRGGLSVYSGLGDWEDMANDPTAKDMCAPLPFKTYQYAWETRAWTGKKTAWGSDPICLDIFKFTPHAIEQLGWILDTGVKFGTAIQNVWNRDMFIYHSVMAGRSYVMSSEYRGSSSARYIYEPFCKVTGEGTDTGCRALVAKKSAVDGKPFIVIDATNDVEPVNFESLQLLRRELERVCPDGAVGSIGGGRMYALGISADDLDKYIRGNEEERKNYMEGNPAALIKGYDISPTTFRKWLITEDGDQLRFKFKAYHSDYSKVAGDYGYVGAKEFGTKPVFIAVAVDPMRGGKPGINGAQIPEANPEYDLAELAIAPVFMNHVYTNEFVGDVSTLGHGTYFGVVKGLNGQWGWYNIQSEKNPDMKIGNFKGIFEIVPKPEARAVYATSFVYRRCAQPLKSLCPAENKAINPYAETKTSKVAAANSVDATNLVWDLVLKTPVVARAGDTVKVGSTAIGYVVTAPTLQSMTVQFTTAQSSVAMDAAVEVGVSHPAANPDDNPGGTGNDYPAQDEE